VISCGQTGPGFEHLSQQCTATLELAAALVGPEIAIAFFIWQPLKLSARKVAQLRVTHENQSLIPSV
jgi:hypothetical protein